MAASTLSPAFSAKLTGSSFSSAGPVSSQLAALRLVSFRFQNAAVRLGVSRGRHSGIIKAEIQFFNASEAKEAVEKNGFKLVDVRDQTQYDRGHIPGSLHVPFYVENNDMDISTIIKRQAHNNFAGFLYGLAYTKINTDFVSDITKTTEKDAKLLLVCQEGLRARTAAEKLEEAGFQNVAMLTSGLNACSPGTFPKEGKRELNDAGKGGFVSIQTQFSFVLASLLLGAYLFLQFFPEQAVQIFGQGVAPIQ